MRELSGVHFRLDVALCAVSEASMSSGCWVRWVGALTSFAHARNAPAYVIDSVWSSCRQPPWACSIVKREKQSGGGMFIGRKIISVHASAAVRER